MVFNDIERKQCEVAVTRFIEARRPPLHLRDQVDLSFRLRGQSVEIFEVRPAYRDPSTRIEHAVAKATYVRSANNWRIYWQRADLKWHRYGPCPEARSVDRFLEIVGADPHGCFFG